VPTDGAAVPSIASILVVFFAFGVATIVLLWLMDMLVDALRWQIIDRRKYSREDPTPGDAQEGARRSWWRRLFGG